MAVFESSGKAVEFSIESLRTPQGREGFLCISQSTFALAYSLVLGYGYWRSRYYKEGSVTLETLDDEEWEEVTDYVDLAVEELSMTGCDDLITAVGEVSTQIQGIGLQMGDLSISLLEQNQTACCSSYGSVPPDSVEDEGDPEGDPAPDGFESWEDYFDYKCEAANKIVDDWISTIGNLASLSGVLGAISAIAIGLFLQTSLLSGLLVGLMVVGFSSGVAAAIVIGTLVALVAGGVGLFAYFLDLAGDMEEAKEQIICDLWGATSVGDAIALLLAFTSDVALGLTYDPADDDALFQASVSTIASAILRAAVFNSLFELDTEVQGYAGEVDCGVDCVEEEGCAWAWRQDQGGTQPSGNGDLTKDGEERTLYAEEGTDNVWRIMFQLDGGLSTPGDDCDSETFVNSQVQFVDWQNPGAPVLTTDKVWWWDGSQLEDDVLGQDPPTSVQEICMWQIASLASFEMNIKLLPGNF